jgi:hypothetical protein
MAHSCRRRVRRAVPSTSKSNNNAEPLTEFLKWAGPLFWEIANRKGDPFARRGARSASSGSYGPGDLMNIEDCQNENSRP